MFNNLTLEYWAEQDRILSHAQTTKAHIGRMLDDGCTNIMAVAYDVIPKQGKKTIVTIVSEDSGFVDSKGNSWDAAYPINIYGNPLSIYEYAQMKHYTLKDNGLKHSGDIS